MSREKLLHLVDEALTAQRLAHKAADRISEAVLEAVKDRDFAAVLDLDFLERLAELGAHADRVASRVIRVIAGPVLLFGPLVWHGDADAKRMAAALQAGNDKGKAPDEDCACGRCKGNREAVEASVQRAREAAQRPTG